MGQGRRDMEVGSGIPARRASSGMKLYRRKASADSLGDRRGEVALNLRTPSREISLSRRVVGAYFC